MPRNLSNPAPSKRRPLFAATALLVSLTLSLTAAELYLRHRANTVQASDRLDPGLVEYDAQLGWRLATDWQGRHRHHDFDTQYTTNSRGFRGPPPALTPDPENTTRYAVVGDSFCFGIGVADDQTFVHLLNARTTADTEFLNFSIPGFSTDQQCLLIEQRVLYAHPNVILLVIYLGNDLMDNTLAFPLQADKAKPYFVLSPTGLILKHNPVPLITKPADQQRIKPMDMVIGPSEHPPHLVTKLLSSMELSRRLGWEPPIPINFANRMNQHVPPMLDLFSQIVTRIQQTCDKHEIDLVLALLPGRSYVARSQSLSAKVQEHLRAELMRTLSNSEIHVIDMTTALNPTDHAGRARWYYPNEGHLTPEGHRVVADLLWQDLTTN